MIEPLKKDDTLLAEICATDPGRGFALWWLGQSGFLVKHAGGAFLLDPYLSDSLTKKYATTDKPHVRMTERAIDPARLDFLDWVSSSHNHTDHLDAETLLPLRAANPNLQMIIPEANRAFVADRLQCEPAWPLGLDAGERCTLGDVEIHAVPAAHEQIDRDEAGRCHYLGYVVRCGGQAIYHSGDTVRYDGMAERLRPFAVDVALLPINGRLPERRVSGNLWGHEAAQLAKEIGAGLVVPCHYDMFEFNTESPDEFVAECERLEQPYRVLRCGEAVVSF
ncbi:MAG: MBL fold metallo-hydrolase [Planctomycetales bacterium]|nr:MBL fold metallo-hydrolase [Planctomycetales bacterium]